VCWCRVDIEQPYDSAVDSAIWPKPKQRVPEVQWGNVAAWLSQWLSGSNASGLAIKEVPSGWVALVAQHRLDELAT